MYVYAISVPDPFVLDSDWQKAIAAARLKRIELDISTSCAANAEELALKVQILTQMQSEGKVIVGSVHLPFGAHWEYSGLDEAERRATVENVKKVVVACRPLGCRLFTMHTCLEPIAPEDRAAEIEAFRKTLADLVPFALGEGVFLNAENLPRSCLGNTAEELFEMLKGFPENPIGVNFDVNHLCGHPEKIPEGIALHASRLRSFHFSDYDGIDECHWYPGLGVIDWAAVMEEVRRLPNDVQLTFEASRFLHAPEWKSRKLDPAIPLAAAVHNVFLMENAAEFQRRKAKLVLL